MPDRTFPSHRWKVLFVCGRNQKRSPTADQVFAEREAPAPPGTADE